MTFLEFKVSDYRGKRTDYEVGPRNWHDRHRYTFKSSLTLFDGPSLQDRVLGSYNSDVKQHPRHNVFASTNVITMHYDLRFDQFLTKDVLIGKFVESYWKLKWSAFKISKYILKVQVFRFPKSHACKKSGSSPIRVSRNRSGHEFLEKSRKSAIFGLKNPKYQHLA